MFKTLPCLANDDFWLVSADTKTCGSPRFFPPTGGLRLPTSKQGGILTSIQTKVNKKNDQKSAVFARPAPSPFTLVYAPIPFKN